MKNNSGLSLVEVVIMVSVTVFSMLFIWKIYTTFIKISLSNPSYFQASFLAEEGIEAVKFMRDGSWTSNIATLAPSTEYFLIFNGSGWGTTTTQTLIGKFDRRLVISEVFRDAAGNISASGTPDPNTRKVSVTVSWPGNSGTSTREITTYVSNIFEN